MNNDLKDFLENQQEVPSLLSKDTLKISLVYLKPRKLIFKYLCSNIFGALTTLLFCPQYGFGPILPWKFLSDMLMRLDPISCGIFCAFVFFTAGQGFSFLILNKFEKKWIKQYGFNISLYYVAIFFLLGMSLKSITNNHIHHDVPSYYITWIITSIIISFLFCKFIYAGSLISRSEHL
jgi:polyferredoxin